MTTGNNGWLLMAINYYTIYANDTTFRDMAVKLGIFLQDRQNTDTANINHGGVFSRVGLEGTFVAEHQAQAYSGLLYLSQLDGVLQADSISFRASADNLKEFIMSRIYDSTSQRFNVAAGRTDNTSLDAQTTSFLSLPGPDVQTASDTFEITGALDYVFAKIFKEQSYLDPNRIVEGPTFRKDDPDTKCDGMTNIGGETIDASQYVWIEGAGQLAVALDVLIASEPATGSATAIANRDNLLVNLRKIRDMSGGYPTHLGSQFDCTDLDSDSVEDEAIQVGADEINVAPTAWAYFIKASPTVNPYTPNPVLIIAQDALMVQGKGTSEVKITAILRHAASVSQQDIRFEFVSGNGILQGTHLLQ